MTLLAKLPNLSYMVKIGQLRYIQARFEPQPYRNPDVLAAALLPPTQRLGGELRGRFRLKQLRAKPFYYYVLARTRYYDDIFLSAIAGGADCILNIGSGGDTRAHRFSRQLEKKGCRVVEMDQAAAVEAKRVISQRRWPGHRVEYLSIDLNAPAWPTLAAWLAAQGRVRMSVLLEGVSPYIETAAFTRFLSLLAAQLPPGTPVAYDYKLKGVADAFGRSGSTTTPFRLSADRDEVERFHAPLGYQLVAFEPSQSLVRRLVPSSPQDAIPAFDKDCLLRLVTTGEARQGRP